MADSASMRRHAVLPILLLAVSLAACGKSLPSSAGVTKTVTTHGAGTSTSGGGSGGGTNGGGSAGGTHGGGSAGGTNGGGGRAGEHAGGGASHSQAQARARAFATAVNIRASDVPGFAVSSEKQPQHKGATETRAEDELHHCLGGGRAAPGLAEASSGSFE
ncbi:MAG TPA: hypothetical protein VKV16_08380, partial [Solirubrobacteraceae bacterium]|nr:hypothetical protein [Solirubrobacteraceae bacterium]